METRSEQLWIVYNRVEASCGKECRHFEVVPGLCTSDEEAWIECRAQGKLVEAAITCVDFHNNIERLRVKELKTSSVPMINLNI